MMVRDDVLVSNKGRGAGSALGKSVAPSKQTRLPLAERRNESAAHELRPPYIDAREKRRPAQRHATVFSLADADVLFDAYEHSLIQDPRPDLMQHHIGTDAYVAIPPVQHTQQAAKVNAGDQWSAFGRFSHDFSIGRLPTGIRLAEGSYIVRGYLHQLIYAVTLHERQNFDRALVPFGFALQSAMDPDVVLSLLPRLTDSVFRLRCCACRRAW